MAAHTDRLTRLVRSNHTGKGVPIHSAERDPNRAKRMGQGGTRPAPPSKPITEIASHSFIFVGGLPQSGTSLLRQMLLTPLSSGMDSCERSTRCHMTNIEGQWLLKDDQAHHNRLRFEYGAGKVEDESHFLTEKNFTSARAEREMREYLWESWSPWWDMKRPFLVEKSPPNLLKVRWLSQLFAPLARSPPKFLLVVKDPVANGHFEEPRACYDYSRCDPAHPPTRTEAVRKAGGGFALREVPMACKREHLACAAKGNLLRARVAFVESWVRDHERLLADLRTWGAGDGAGPKSNSTWVPVRVVRYEQVARPCFCQLVLAFAFGTAPSPGQSVYLAASDAEAACHRTPKCDQPVFPAVRTASASFETSGGKTRWESFSGSNGTARGDVSPPPFGSGATQGWRRLGYEGLGKGPVAVHKDSSSKRRHAQWRAFLAHAGQVGQNRPAPPGEAQASTAGSGSGSSGSQPPQPPQPLQGTDEAVFASMRLLEPRLNALGYSLLDPGRRFYNSPGDRATDAFAPWAIKAW